MVMRSTCTHFLSVVLILFNIQLHVGGHMLYKKLVKSNPCSFFYRDSDSQTVRHVSLSTNVSHWQIPPLALMQVVISLAMFVCLSKELWARMAMALGSLVDAQGRSLVLWLLGLETDYEEQQGERERSKRVASSPLPSTRSCWAR